ADAAAHASEPDPADGAGAVPHAARARPAPAYDGGGRLVSVSPTLSRYIGRQFAVWCGGVFLAMSGIAFIIDVVELLRRSANKADATLAILVQMSIFKLPYLAQEILPFAMLFGSMLAFWRLTRSSELLVARAAGVSAWQ